MVAPGMLIQRAFEDLSRIRDVLNAGRLQGAYAIKKPPEGGFSQHADSRELVHCTLTAGATTLVFLQVTLTQTNG